MSTETDWTVGIVAQTVEGETALRMTEAQACKLRDSLAWLLDGDAVGTADAAGRLRDSKGRFASLKPSEVCPNGCERYGDWWVPADCPTHLGGIR